MDIFSELNKQLKENGERWEKIDHLINLVKDIEQPNIKDVVNLIILVAEQIRPAKNTTNKINDLQKDINDMLSSLKK